MYEVLSECPKHQPKKKQRENVRIRDGQLWKQNVHGNNCKQNPLLSAKNDTHSTEMTHFATELRQR